MTSATLETKGTREMDTVQDYFLSDIFTHIFIIPKSMCAKRLILYLGITYNDAENKIFFQDDWAISTPKS